MTATNTTPRYRCSFCGKCQEQVDILIAGTGGAYICEECVEMAYEAVQERKGRPTGAAGQPQGKQRGESEPR